MLSEKDIREQLLVNHQAVDMYANGGNAEQKTKMPMPVKVGEQEPAFKKHNSLPSQFSVWSSNSLSSTEVNAMKVNGEAEEEEVHPIDDNTWLRFRPFQLLGLWACDLDADTRLIKPMSTMKYGLTLSLWALIVTCVAVSGHVYAGIANEGVSGWDVARSQFSRHRSTTDSLALSTLMVTGVVTGIVFIWESFRMSRIWPNYWHSLEVLGKVDHEINQRLSDKSSMWIKRVLLGTFLAETLMLTGNNLIAGEEMGLCLPSVLWIAFGLLISNMYLNCVTALILMVFGESIARLCGWCKRLETQVDHLLGNVDPDMEVTFKTRFIKVSHAFIHALKRTEKLFGRILLVFSAITLLTSVLTFFDTLTLFFHHTLTSDWKMSLLVLGSAGICACNFAFTLFPFEMINELVEGIAEVSSKLDLIVFQGRNDNFIYIDHVQSSKPCLFSVAKKKIHYQLKSFQGLNVLNFFTLRRSLIPSILGHFITYCIVLMQFKVSEIGGNFVSRGTFVVTNLTEKD